MEGFLIRGWELVLPGCGETSTLARGAALAARWLHEPRQSAITQWDWGFRTARGGMDPGDLCFRPRGVGVVEVWRDFSSGDKTLFFPGTAGR